MATAVRAPSGYTIEEIDLAGASDELMTQAVDLARAIDREAIPEDPPRPYEVIEQRYRVTTELFRRRWWAAFGDGRRLAGRITVVRNLSGSNEHIRELDLAVLPEHRRRGLGRALLGAGVASIEGGERTLLEWWTSSRIPAAAAFSERTGARAGLHVRMSQLDLGTLDRALMTEWAALDPMGYRLEWITGAAPDRLMQNLITAYRTMNTMPREGLEMEDWVVTPEIVREMERTSKARGQERLLDLAIHEASGETAGFTEVFFDRRVPHLLWQGGTAVVPEHRGKGLGKWVKARMALRVLAEMPEARYIRTGNAGSNAAMLAINHGMGFRLAWENDVWQIPLETAKRYVEASRWRGGPAAS